MYGDVECKEERYKHELLCRAAASAQEGDLQIIGRLSPRSCPNLPAQLILLRPMRHLGHMIELIKLDARSCNLIRHGLGSSGPGRQALGPAGEENLHPDNTIHADLWVKVGL